MMDTHWEMATLGGGCFWCLEAVFQRLRGVERVVSGYAGGHVPHPTYQQVCGGNTGHAEVVQITFDAKEISYRDLLRLFFTMHDPTTRDRQGPDVGTQYRSIILYHDDDQRRAAEKILEECASAFDDPIVTDVEPLETFYAAEDYHQDYYAHHGWQPYCQAVIAPKIARLRQKYLDRLKE